MEEIEVNLEFCLKLLEERKVPVKPNSKYVFVLSKIASAVPKVGSGIGAAVSQGETFFLNRVDKKNSRALADLVYYFSDNRESFRRILIEAAVDIFCSFEIQFMKLTCDGGEKRAMLKLAKNAGGKIFGYFLEKKQGKDLTKKDVVEGKYDFQTYFKVKFHKGKNDARSMVFFVTKVGGIMRKRGGAKR